MSLGFPFNNKGFLGALIPAALSLGKSLFSKGAEGVVSGVGSAVGGALGGKLSDKITGIPSALSAAEQGQQAAEYMNAAYPGTTAWDRLGAGGGGSPSAISATNVEKLKMKQENKMQSRALSTQAMIADRQNRTHLISAAAGYGTPGINEVLRAYDSQPTRPFETPVSISSKKLPAEIHDLTSRGNLSQSQIPQNDRRSRRADEIIDSEIFQRYYGSPSGSLARSAQIAGGAFGDSTADFFRLINNSKIPNRFKFSPIKDNKNMGSEFYNSIKKLHSR